MTYLTNFTLSTASLAFAMPPAINAIGLGLSLIVFYALDMRRRGPLGGLGLVLIGMGVCNLAGCRIS